MRAFLAVCLTTLLVAIVSGCFLISATGEFDLRNDTSGTVRVVWTDLVEDDGPQSASIAPGSTERLASQRFLEADSVPPSYYFATFTIQVDSGTEWTTVYTRPESGEIFDADWEAVETGFRRHTYTFTLSAGLPD